ncbi:MAG TPA: hypothetical protein DER01_04445 [Phycisphaerales bacterium]|nr:hypothetical protein [Phycisphaerales bacterium]|tara:strand:- start:3 stop:977 length:975 start_codon:yes stop_codon:yes gene_type:complete
MTTATAPQTDMQANEEQSSLPSLHMETDNQLSVVHSDASLMMDPRVFEHMQRVCKVYANSDVVPKQFAGNLANCMIAYELAYRMRVNVFMLMQSMYVVSGKPGLEAKMAIALVNQRGPFRGPIQFQVDRDNSGNPVSCTAYAVHKSGERCETTVTWDVVIKEGWDKKPGSKWKTMPEQMFKYRSAAWLARTYCPEVLMGMHTDDELEDTYGDTRYIPSTTKQSGAKALTSKLTGSKSIINESAKTTEPNPVPDGVQVDTETGDTGLSVVDELIDYASGALGCNQTQAERRLIDAAKQEFNIGDLGKLNNDQLAAMYSLIQEDKI